MAEARELNHSFVGTEHLLLGLLREDKGIAAQVLRDAGINLEKARAETLRLLGKESPAPPTVGSARPEVELTLTPCPLCKTGSYTIKRVRLRGTVIIP